MFCKKTRTIFAKNLKYKKMKDLFVSISVLLAILLLSDCADKDSKLFFEIPDANFKTYLLENFDSNKDGKISLSEAKAVTEMDCSGRSIEALDGIEHFVSLEKLNCSSNQLEELELRYNKKIKWLVCTNNKVPLTIYFAKSSPLTNKNFVLPKENATPDAAQLVNPFDVTKGVFDEGKTDFVICLND